MIEYFIAFIWAFAEATFFFFIPDIYLTRIALFDAGKAGKACFIAAMGASVGGCVMYLWAAYDCSTVFYFLTFIPGISSTLIAIVVNSLETHPFYALFIAPFKGIPYKIYAAAIGQQHLNFTLFFFTSFFARLLRFLLITTAGCLLASLLKRYFQHKTIIYIHMLIWVIVYILYFIFVT